MLWYRFKSKVMVLEGVSPFKGLFGELQRRQLPLSKVDQVGLFADGASLSQRMLLPHPHVP